MKSKRPVAIALVASLTLPPALGAAGDTPGAAPAASASTSTSAPPSSAPPAAPAPKGGTAASSEAKALAETLFFTGRGMMEAGRYAEACTKFEQSYQLDAAAGTLLNLAVCHEKIGKIASAWGEFKQALSDAKKAGRADREELAQQHIDVLEPDLPFLTIHVPSEVRVPSLEVVRNGLPLVSGGWDAELPVDPGVVEIVTRAPGYKPKSQKVEIAKKQHLSVTVERLEKAPVPVVVMQEPGWSTKKKLGLGLIGAGVIGIGIGGYFGYRAFDSKKKSDDACPVYDDERRCTTVGAARMDDANRYSWIANIGVGVGLASLAVGTWMFVTGGNAQPEGAPGKAATAKKLDWGVAGGPWGMSGFLRGSF